MPLILTDEYIRKNCMSAYPVPLKALKGLKPNADKTPNYISKRGRSGIRPADLPIYAPASVGSLANSISNISKLEPAVVETYLEKMIREMDIAIDDIMQDFYRDLDSYTGEEEEEETKSEEEPDLITFPEEEIVLRPGTTFALGGGGGAEEFKEGEQLTERVIPRRDQRAEIGYYSAMRKGGDEF